MKNWLHWQVLMGFIDNAVRAYFLGPPCIDRRLTDLLLFKLLFEVTNLLYIVLMQLQQLLLGLA